MQKRLENIKNGFKEAFHSVTRAPRNFLPFFISIFLIECMLLTLFLCYSQNAVTRQDTVNGAYDYHVKIMGLTEAEMLPIRNDERTVFSNDRNYRTVSVEKYESTYYEDAYSLSLLLLTGNKNYGIWGVFQDDSLQANFEAMQERYKDILKSEDNHITLYFSPLYTLENDLAVANRSRNGAILLVLLIGTVLLLSIYRIYTDSMKFLYGVYAVFGGTARKMRENAFSRLFFCALFSLLPAYYASMLLCSWIYRSAGFSFSFHFLIPRFLLFTLLLLVPVLYIAVYSPTKAASRKEPMRLLAAEDNADIVSSPARSVHMQKRRFPLGYEVLAALRFRKHYIFLALSCALISTLFVSGSYIAFSYRANLSAKEKTAADFAVYFDGEDSVSDEDFSVFSQLKGATSTYRNYTSVFLQENADLLMIPAASVTRKNNLLYEKENGAYLTANARFTVATEDVIARYCMLYHIEGDPYAVLTDENSIILSSTYENASAFRFSAGDTVTVAVADRDEDDNPLFLTPGDSLSFAQGLDLWRQMREKISYHYETFRVAAVITDYPSGADGIPLLMNRTAFTKTSGQTPYADSVSVCVDYTSAENHSAVLNRLLQRAAKLSRTRVEITGTSFDLRMEESRCYEGMLLSLSALLLLFVPVYWFYKQNIFYRKREKEMDILRALGAPRGKIRGLYLSATLTAIPAAILSFLFAACAVGILFWFTQRFLPNAFHIPATLLTSVSLPFGVVLAVLGVTLLCSIFSCLFPYLRYRKAARAVWAA